MSQGFTDFNKENINNNNNLNSNIILIFLFKTNFKIYKQIKI